MSGIIKKIFKLFAYFLLVLVIFIAAVSAIFIATFDANEYKRDLSDLVREQTGRDLQFHGDVGLTFFPALGMKLGALSLSNAKGFGDAPMLKVNAVSISVDVASLLVLSPEVDQLLLRDLDINLQKNKTGKTNWDDLAKSGQTSTSAEAGDTASADQPMQIGGAFGGLNIQDARLLWKDAQAGVEYRISDLDLSTGRITADAPFPLQMRIALQSGSEIDAVVDLEGQIRYLIANHQLDLSDLNVKLDASGSLMPFDPMNVEVSANSLSLLPDARSIDIRGLALILNNLQLNGDVNVVDYAQPEVNFKLMADTLDIDELIGTPPPGSQPESTAEPEAVKTGSAEDVEIKLPMELLRSLKIDGSLDIAKLKLQNLWMQQIKLDLKANNGIVDLKPLQMSLYDGNFEGAIQINAKGKVPRYQVRKKLTSVQIAQLMKDFSGDDKVSGSMNASVSVTTGGEWLSELKKNSNGDMSLAFTDGGLKGFNLRYLLDKAKAKLRGDKAPDESAEKTDFSALSLTGKITKGIFSSDDLDLQAPALRVGGKGKANLNNDTVDYLVNAKLVDTIEGQQGGSQDELSGLLIPVRIKGPFTDPKIDVQLDEMLKAQSGAKIAAEKAKLKAEIAEEKAALEKQLAEEKAALKAAKEKELEKQKAVLEAKKKAEKKKAKDKAKDKLKKLLE